MKIYRLGTTAKGYGGTIYENMVDQVLRDAKDSAGGLLHSVEIRRYQFKWKKPWRYFEILGLIWFYLENSSPRDGFLIRTLEASLVPSRKNTIPLVFHVDWAFSSWPSKLLQMWAWTVFRLSTPKDTPIVVIAEYWKERLQKLGYTNIHVIFCAYDYSQYEVTDGQVQNFLKKYGLEGQEIVYIGNPQKKKGADIAYRALEGSHFTLVCSGEGDLDLPVPKLNLSFHEYLCLLKASRVVLTLSRFEEGWNRVAHEALLMGTPVIGSGLGGMRELLTNTHQTQIADGDLAKIRQLVNSLASRQNHLTDEDQRYLRSFETSVFQKQWLKVVENAQKRNSKNLH